MSPRVPLLIIDTSIIGVSLAITDASSPAVNLLWSDSHLENMGSVPAIGGLLQRGLLHCGLAFSDIVGIAVSVGPGTFTGIKVGLAFSFGLKMARPGGIPMLGVPAIELARDVIANNLPGERAAELETAASSSGPDDAGEVRLFMPATRTHGFVAQVENGITKARLVEPGGREFQSEILTTWNNSRNIVFQGWPALTHALAASGKKAEIIDEIRMCNAAVYGMAECATRSWPQGFQQENPLPRYLRLSTAEEKLLADQANAAVSG